MTSGEELYEKLAGKFSLKSGTRKRASSTRSSKRSFKVRKKTASRTLGVRSR